jgi:hypothetical protein
MHDSILIAAPLLIAAIVMAVRFVGCSLDEGGLAVPYDTAVLATANLVSFWSLSETTGTAAKDTATGGNDGKYQGGTGVTLGVPGLAHLDTVTTAAKFDGAAGYVSVSFKSNVNPAKFTVEALVNPSAIGNGDPNDYHAIVSSRSIDTTTLDTAGYILYLHGNAFEAWVGDGTTNWPSVSVAADVKASGGPYYVVMTYDGTKLELYVNPTDTATDILGNPSQFKQAAVTYTPTTKNELRIAAGANEATPPKYWFPGVIQNVAVYDTPLAYGTIQSHFAMAMTGIST